MLEIDDINIDFRKRKIEAFSLGYRQIVPLIFTVPLIFIVPFGAFLEKWPGKGST